MNVSLPDATAYNSKQLAIQKDMTPSLYAMFFKVTYNVRCYISVAEKHKTNSRFMTEINKYKKINKYKPNIELCKTDVISSFYYEK